MDSERAQRVDLAAAELSPCRMLEMMRAHADLPTGTWENNCDVRPTRDLFLRGSRVQAPFCTRLRGHDGPHVMHNYFGRANTEIARWIGDVLLHRDEVLEWRRKNA